MGQVVGYTAEYMDEIANATVVGGTIVGDDLVLTKRDNTTINAGNVRGPIGPAGPAFLGAKVLKTVAQEIPNDTAPAVIWESEEFDVGGFHSPSLNPERLTVVSSANAGYYMVNASIPWESGTGDDDGSMISYISKNGTPLPGGSSSDTLFGFPVLRLTQNLSTIVYLAQNDYVSVLAYHNTGVPKDVTVAMAAFSLYRIGA